MADVLTKEQRSYCMSRIHGRDTQPELILRKKISSNKIRGYRVHYRLLGKPDIVFPRKKIAIFIDGCFWHKCPKCFPRLSTSKKYWVNKVGSNIRRDEKVTLELRRKGWRVIRIWEHEIRKNLNNSFGRISKLLDMNLGQKL